MAGGLLGLQARLLDVIKDKISTEQLMNENCSGIGLGSGLEQSGESGWSSEGA